MRVICWRAIGAASRIGPGGGRETLLNDGAKLSLKSVRVANGRIYSTNVAFLRSDRSRGQ